MISRVYHIILKGAQSAYRDLHPPLPNQSHMELLDSQGASNIIFEELKRRKPCMIARYGATEMACVLNYLSVKRGEKNPLRYIKGEIGDWWWNENIKGQMQRWSGFFPPTEENLTYFCELMLEDSRQVDVLGVYDSVKQGIHKMKDYMLDDIRYIFLNDMNPFVVENPWSRALKGKKVLVIHPFAELIAKQYEKRIQLFENKDVLPEFSLSIIKAVQSLGGVNSQGFETWFDALDWMKKEMDMVDYEIALIGCGAYGFPLAAHAKRTGHQAIHMGGALQLLFGIKGKRWENPLFLTEDGHTYKELMDNPAWVRPEQYMTEQAKNVEEACYW